MVIRNLTLLGHTASGKSSIIESLAFINKTNKQEIPNSYGTPNLMDVDEEEKRRKTTIFN
jgi:translation elongation factor EF-G